MRFITEPRKKGFLKVHLRTLLEGCELTGIDLSKMDSREAEKKIYTLNNYLKHTPGSCGDMEEYSYISKIGVVYGELIAKSLKWKSGFVVCKEKDPGRDCPIVSSSDESYLFSPVMVVWRSYNRKRALMEDLFKKIKNNQLPPSNPGQLLDLDIYYYDKRQKISLFNELKQEIKIGIVQASQAALEMLGFMPKVNKELLWQHIEEIITSMDKELSESKADPEGKPISIYLATMGSLYGECLVRACNYKWATSFLEDIYERPVIVSSDERYWLHPPTLIKSAFKKKKRPNLFKLYRQIKEGRLPPPESDLPQEIS